ncbi:protein FAM234A [Engraulis encrasicolus]|uniref:protein FAM234A n=1 Tax=Engraulis encrasicolus TaxID=184585 RepID=UPI002FD0F705
MTNPGVCPSEVDPLKGEEGDLGGSGVGAPTSPSKKSKGACGGGLRFSRLSGWRTAAFLFSLFLCLTIVFAFSFILPCPTRPDYLQTWNRTLHAAATYDFLAIEYIDEDKVKDVLFTYKSNKGSEENKTCESEGLSSPCVFVLAVDGTHGNNIWELPLNYDLLWAQCGLGVAGVEGKGTCLFAHTNTLTAISYTGNVLWQQSSSPGVGAALPVLSVPDLNGDGTEDLALILPQQNQMKLVFLSGKTGVTLGSEVEVCGEVSSSHMLHQTAKKAQYLLLQTGSGLIAEGLWNLVAKAGLQKEVKKDAAWEKRRNGTGPIMIYPSRSLQRVSSVSLGGGVPPLLLMTGPSPSAAEGEQDTSQPGGVSIMELLDGQSLTSRWRANTTKLLSQPTFGFFNKDDIPDVVMEEDTGNGTKRVVVLDGNSGLELWSVTLQHVPHAPAPASIVTLHSYSVFMLWGEMLGNQTESGTDKHFSNLLYPYYADVLLQKTIPVEQIIACEVTLLERGRHAAYLVLTGPHASEGAEPEAAGSVVLTKRKLKGDITDSLVLGVRGTVAPDNAESIKEAFQRLRFQD